MSEVICCAFLFFSSLSLSGVLRPTQQQCWCSVCIRSVDHTCVWWYSAYGVRHWVRVLVWRHEQNLPGQQRIQRLSSAVPRFVFRKYKLLLCTVFLHGNQYEQPLSRDELHSHLIWKSLCKDWTVKEVLVVIVGETCCNLLCLLPECSATLLVAWLPVRYFSQHVPVLNTDLLCRPDRVFGFKWTSLCFQVVSPVL